MAQTLKEFKLEQQQISLENFNKSSFPNDLKIVVEGDSWFDYALRKDIIDYLRKMGYAILKYSQGGDTLENMIYGSKYKIRNNNVVIEGPRSLEKTLNSINQYNSKFLLFSGGGNDIVGNEIIGYLNHKGSNPTTLVNKPIFEEKLGRMKNTLNLLINKVREANPECSIIMHGYDYPKVNGKGYRFLGLKLAGPWILPAMGQKGITLKSDQKNILKYFINEFNSILQELDNENSNFYYINLRGKFPNENEWHNEIHLKNKGFKTIANIYHDKIVELLGYNPLE